jgi:catechol 2,3-dioxygenase-like lactoylglutathione lyase family enzyme
MKKYLDMSHCVFPTPDIEKTSEFYVTIMGFCAVPYLNASEPHICLYRDGTEIILTSAKSDKVYPNRELYGYGYDAYFITDDQEALQDEFQENGAKIVRPLQKTDYHNSEFVVEDRDGRWLGFGIKTMKSMKKIDSNALEE